MTAPADYACTLASSRFWRDERQRLIGTHPDFPEAAMLLERPQELAHALVLVLSRLPKTERPRFAERFYAAQEASTQSGRGPGELAAAIALLGIELAGSAELARDPIHDLLVGAAQGDDLTQTPEPVVAELQRAIARIRFDADADDPENPQAVASAAIAEVLDPSSETIALQEVLARLAFAAVETWDPERVLAFLLDVNRLFAER